MYVQSERAGVGSTTACRKKEVSRERVKPPLYQNACLNQIKKDLVKCFPFMKKDIFHSAKTSNSLCYQCSFITS